MPLRATFAAAALAAAPLTAFAPHADAAPAAYPPCDSSHAKSVGNGWTLTTPAIVDRVDGYRCKLVLGDRYSDEEIYDGVLTLQRNLNYCYRTHLKVDGIYGPLTRDAIKRVQRLHKITVDGVYGPQTRSAMFWREYNGKLGRPSEKCYSPI